MDKTAISYIKLKDNLIAHMEKAQKYIQETRAFDSMADLYSGSFTEKESDFMFMMEERAHYGDYEYIEDDQGELTEIDYLKQCIDGYKDLVHASPETPWASDAKALIDRVEQIEASEKSSITELSAREATEKNRPINRMVAQSKKESGIEVSKSDQKNWKQWVHENNISIHPYKEGQHEVEAVMDRLYQALKSTNAESLFMPRYDIEHDIQKFVESYVKLKEIGPSYDVLGCELVTVHALDECKVNADYLAYAIIEAFKERGILDEHDAVSATSERDVLFLIENANDILDTYEMMGYEEAHAQFADKYEALVKRSIPAHEKEMLQKDFMALRDIMPYIHNAYNEQAQFAAQYAKRMESGALSEPLPHSFDPFVHRDAYDKQLIKIIDKYKSSFYTNETSIKTDICTLAFNMVSVLEHRKRIDNWKDSLYSPALSEYERRGAEEMMGRIEHRISSLETDLDINEYTHTKERPHQQKSLKDWFKSAVNSIGKPNDRDHVLTQGGDAR